MTVVELRHEYEQFSRSFAII